MSFTVISAAFTPIETMADDAAQPLKQQAASIASLISHQSQQIMQAVEWQDSPKPQRHFLCSTMLELPFTSGALTLADLSHGEDYAPTSYLNTYECASWGYSLRYALQKLAQDGHQHGYVLFSILDANLLGLSFWRENENWGHSGFGLTSVLLHCSDVEQARHQLATSCAQTWNSTPEFATLIRRHSQNRPELTLSLPFFPENIRQIFDKLLADQPKLIDRHERWGHVFGSDPWLNLIEHQCAEKPKAAVYLPASIALNGYYCWTEVHMTEESQCWVNPVWQWNLEAKAC